MPACPGAGVPATTRVGGKPLPTALKSFVNRLHALSHLSEKREPIAHLRLWQFDGEERKVISTNDDFLNAVKCDQYDALLGLEHVRIVPAGVNEDINGTGYYPVEGTQIGAFDSYKRFFKRSILETQVLIDKFKDLRQDNLEACIPDEPVNPTARELKMAHAESVDDGELSTLEKLSRKSIDEVRFHSNNDLNDMAEADRIFRKYLLDPQTQQVHPIAEGMRLRTEMAASVRPPDKVHMPLQKMSRSDPSLGSHIKPMRYISELLRTPLE
ncbi:hypothetical protein LTR56_012698 [Elasticomyces elasticus]|nr:hypothetical protein LTR56_012698 [Elasticomyces elasticus]KAK5754400.1 hypothetical protein LTS12_015469 [Elasticomyces elasticus]